MTFFIHLFLVDPNCEYECMFDDSAESSDKLDDYLMIEDEAETEDNMVSSTAKPDSTFLDFADNSNSFFTLPPDNTEDDDFIELRGKFDICKS